MKNPGEPLVYMEPGLLNRIADKHALDAYQRKEQAKEDTEASAFFENPELHEALRGIVKRLPENEGNLIRMRYWEDLSLDEIAQTMGLERAAVKKLLTKVLAKLRVMILVRLHEDFKLERARGHKNLARV